MPIYTYECRDAECAHRERQVEIMQTHERAASATYCNNCGMPLTRIVSTGAIPAFKGSGFYCNDSAT